MISVFAGFIFSNDVTIKMFGLGLATAVLLDATIVRLVLMPATLSVRGTANWWLPRWLDRALPHVDVDSATPAEDEEVTRDDRTPTLVHT